LVTTDRLLGAEKTSGLADQPADLSLRRDHAGAAGRRHAVLGNMTCLFTQESEKYQPY
jgi:hypothetical protein